MKVVGTNMKALEISEQEVSHTFTQSETIEGKELEKYGVLVSSLENTILPHNTCDSEPIFGKHLRVLMQALRETRLGRVMALAGA